MVAKKKARIPGSRSAVGRFFLRHGISVKKSLYAAEQQRADVARAAAVGFASKVCLILRGRSLSTRLPPPPTW
jgi:hypothetical protein